MKKCLIIYFLLISTMIFSQVEDVEDLKEETQEKATEELPMGFQNITIGLNLEETKEALINNGYIDFRGDPDVSMLLSENRSIIESDGFNYIKRGYFQFYNEVLYTITLIVDTSKVDYYSMFRQFVDKYGKYKSLNPDIVLWENENIRLTLEKPLTIKYVGLNIYNQLIEEDTTKKSIQDRLREDFIDAF